MCILSLFRSRRHKNVYFNAYKKVLNDKYDLSVVRCIYRLGTAEYLPSVSDLVCDFNVVNVIDYLDRIKYNAKSDNIVFLVLVGDSNKSILTAIKDSLEYLSYEEVIIDLDINFNEIDLSQFEIIYNA